MDPQLSSGYAGRIHGWIDAVHVQATKELALPSTKTEQHIPGCGKGRGRLDRLISGVYVQW